MPSPLRIAVIGAGRIGRKHIGVIRSHPDFVLAGIAEPDPGAAAAFPEVPVHADVGAMLDAVRPDAVIVASPNQLHLPHALACCSRGVPFILEKPVTDTAEAASELCRAVSSAGVPTLVGHHRRHHLQLIETRRLVRGGAIGDVVGVSGVWATRKPGSYFEDAPWRRQAGGGPVLINLIHEIDFLRYCIGEIVSVSAVTSSRQRGFAVEDSAALTLAFDTGAIGTVLLSDAAVSPWTMEQGTGESPEFPFSGMNGYRFIGSTGSLEAPELTLWSQAAPDPDWMKPIAARRLHAGRRDPYVAQLDHFRDVVRGEAQSLQPAADGARTLIATLAVTEAAETGSTIRLTDRYLALESAA